MRRRLRSRERGAVGMVTTLMLTAAIALSAVVIDVGTAWQERRHLVVSTDAAALAAAQDYLKDVDGCSATAPTYITSNNDEATMSSCAHTPRAGDDAGWVTVEAEATVDFNFARIVGVNDTTVASSTSVSYDNASAISGGLRPFGLCLDVLDDLDPPLVAGNGERYEIVYGKDDQPDSCGGEDVPGNWGVLDFDGGANKQKDIKDWVEKGYKGPPDVAIGDVIEGDTGAFSNSLRTELDVLMTVPHFALPIFDVATGNGANSEFTIANFAAVRLVGYKATGPEADRYLELEFVDEIVEGTGGGPPTDYGAFVIGICAVDGIDPAAACP